ncbi:mRNA turnover protein 4 homolog isoform X2 [Patiria miniata]|uniref:Ribosome assembly factor mrt4 n=1 Tax=Patiria miniata TaxID=46514 RepID=A0A913ZJ37_PATMI|nr:mRNA turnover protein 4 homolog isoform X2 [Patiria miniata]
MCVVSLTNTRKKGLELKQNLIEEVRASVDRYARIFIFSVENMRNSKIKDVRNMWKHSRFFYGKNKVIAVALGKDRAGEYREGLHMISSKLKGNVGLLFTNETKEAVIEWFDEYVEPDFARSGNVARSTVVLDEGPLTQFTHSMEPHLRQLGLPTLLKKGVVLLVGEHTVCKEGEPLTPEQARILKLLGNAMVDFKIDLLAMWSNNGTFEDLKTSEVTDARSYRTTQETEERSDGEQEVEGKEEEEDDEEEE